MSSLKADFHNHILPGIDDGSADNTESLNIRKQLAEWGIERCIYTPHIYQELYPNTPESIIGAYDKLMEPKHYRAPFKKDTFAAEYMLDAAFKQRLENKEPLLCLKDNFLLIELPLYTQNHFLDQLIFDISMAGYQPVLAHPERYIYLHSSPGEYQRLKNMGCLFQLNLLSLAGYYSEPVQHGAEKLLKAGLIDFISTDIHHATQLPVLENLLRSRNWHKWAAYPFQNELFLN